MEAFNTDTFTIRQLLKNESDEINRGKNYFIPPYQRKYDWGEDEVKKLIDDIYEQSNEKSDTGYNPYFIGGIVLSQQSMLGDKRSKKSLEVIDGQQRLTTIVLILSCLVQVFKFQNRLFEHKQEASNHLINDISKILKIESLNLDTMNVEKKYILERSDNLFQDFTKTIDFLSQEKFLDEKKLIELLTNNDDSKKLIYLIVEIMDKIAIYDDNELIDFTIQLLNNTWLVVTKTISIETGFFIFEKLNDSGIALEPQDLLKNYLFRTSTEQEYTDLTKKWDLFLIKVKDINTTKSKILPRDFLDQYLTLTGNLTNNRKGKTFKVYKKIHIDSFDKSMDLLDDLMLIAGEYYNIKRNTKISFYINSMNFKLGYLMILSFYKKFGAIYIDYLNDILLLIVRIGLTYLTTGQSKALSTLIPLVCSEIMKQKDNDIQSSIRIIQSYINASIIKQENIFDEVISSTNLLRKKPLTRVLFKVMEFHLSKRQLPPYFNLFLIMPKEYVENCNYEEINEDNYSKYSTFIGNLIADENNDFNDIDELCFNSRYTLENNTLMINDISKDIKIDNEQITVKDISIDNINWGKNTIMDRSQMIANLATHIIIKDHFDKDFFL